MSRQFLDECGLVSIQPTQQSLGEHFSVSHRARGQPQKRDCHRLLMSAGNYGLLKPRYAGDLELIDKVYTRWTGSVQGLHKCDDPGR